LFRKFSLLYFVKSNKDGCLLHDKDYAFNHLHNNRIPKNNSIVNKYTNILENPILKKQKENVINIKEIAASLRPPRNDKKGDDDY